MRNDSNLKNKTFKSNFSYENNFCTKITQKSTKNSTQTISFLNGKEYEILY